jgi:hypothetical protein
LTGVVLSAAGALLLLEVGLRFYARSNTAFLGRLRMHDLLAVKVAPMGDFGFKQKPGTSLRYFNGAVAAANSMGFRGPEVSPSKPAGTIRIVLAGGSSTHGWGVEDGETLDACMRRELAARWPERRFEVVNLGFDGYDSFQDYERLRLEGVRYEPDVIVVNNGINDVRNARYPDLEDPDPRTLLWRDVVAGLRELEKRGRPDLKIRLKHWSYLLQFIGVVRTSWRHERGIQTRMDGTQPDPNPEAFDYFERNMRRIGALASGHDVALILSTSPSSIPTKYDPGDKSPRDYWIGDAAQTQELRDEIDARMRRVAADLRRAGMSAAYVEHDIPPDEFLDDAHLTPEGNAMLAHELCEAITDVVGLSLASPGPAE